MKASSSQTQRRKPTLKKKPAKVKAKASTSEERWEGEGGNPDPSELQAKNPYPGAAIAEILRQLLWGWRRKHDTH